MLIALSVFCCFFNPVLILFYIKSLNFYNQKLPQKHKKVSKIIKFSFWGFYVFSMFSDVILMYMDKLHLNPFNPMVFSLFFAGILILSVIIEYVYFRFHYQKYTNPENFELV